jgi:hypothetical protein
MPKDQENSHQESRQEKESKESQPRPEEQIMRAKPILTPLLTLSAVIATLAFSASPALAASGYGFAGSFLSEQGAGNGEFKEPSGIAVNQSSGNVYVVDKGNNRVEWFNSTGSKFEGQFNGSGTFANEGGKKAPEPLSSPGGIAVDNSGKTAAEDPSVGDVYVADVEHGVIDKFSATGKYEGQLNGTCPVLGECPRVSSFRSHLEGVAVDPTGNLWVYVENGSADEFSDTGSPLVTGFNTLRGTSPGLAVDSSDDVYVLSQFGRSVLKFDGTTDREPVAEFDSAVDGLAIDPATNDLFVSHAGSIAEYGPFGEPYETPIDQFGASPLVDNGGNGIAVNLATGAVYVADSSSGQVDIFMPGAAEAPAVVSESALVKSTEATLEAQVNPDNLATTFSFEYGTSSTLAGATVLGAGELAATFGNQPVSIATGAVLIPSTTYFYRVTAKSTGGEVKGKIESFTTAPTPYTDLVENVTATTAKFNGHLTLSPADAQYSFDYNVGPECIGNSTPVEDAGTGAGNKSVSAEVTGLQPNATYSVCLVSSNASGSEVDPTVPPVQFKTPAATPTVDSENVSAIDSTEATLEAQVNPNNEDTHGYFQYATAATVDGSGSLTGATQIPALPGADLGGAFGDQPLGPVALTSLTPGRTYYYQAVGSNATGVSYGTVQSFQTIGFPLVVGEAQNLTRTTALLSGTIDPEDGATTYYFKYIDQAGYEAARARSASDPYTEGAETETREMQPSDEPQAIESFLAQGLLPDTVYHYELVAKNAAGTVTGQDETFTTGAGTPPIVTTGGSSSVTDSTATLSGAINTQGLAVSYAFEVSTDPNNYGFPTGAGTVNIGVSEANITVSLQGLQAGTTYYYRALATSLDGTSYGAGQSFTTPGFPSPFGLPVTPPLIASPAIAFPTETGTVAVVKAKALTKAQKLAAALKTCTKKPKKQRPACRKQARKRYEPVKKKRA